MAWQNHFLNLPTYLVFVLRRARSSLVNKMRKRYRHRLAVDCSASRPTYARLSPLDPAQWVRMGACVHSNDGRMRIYMQAVLEVRRRDIKQVNQDVEDLREERHRQQSQYVCASLRHMMKSSC